MSGAFHAYTLAMGALFLLCLIAMAGCALLFVLHLVARLLTAVATALQQRLEGLR